MGYFSSHVFLVDRFAGAFLLFHYNFCNKICKSNLLVTNRALVKAALNGRSYVSDVLLGSVGGGGQLVLGNIQNNQDTVSCLIVFIWAFFYHGMVITVEPHFCLYGNRNNTRKK